MADTSILYWIGVMSNDPATLADFAGSCESFRQQLYPILYTDEPIPLIQTNQYSWLAPRAFGVLIPST